MGGGVDVGEMLVGVNQVTAAWDGTIGSLHGLWNATWGSRAEAHMASAESLLAKGYKRRAARTFRKYVHVIAQVRACVTQVWVQSLRVLPAGGALHGPLE